MAWLISDAGRAATVAGLLAVICLVVIVSLVFIVRSLEGISTSQRKLHLQQATIIGMLLRAGFRPATKGPDWFDDASRTQVARDTHYTQWDWRTPTDD